ncbi:MAG TPA: OsmC family protein [Taishania sp.]|nr:OsmC family protein [Taishania sp.]
MEKNNENRVIAITKENGLLSEVTSNEHVLLVDEPESLGGTNKAMTPSQLLCSSLASCTSITLRMYSNRKSWKLGVISVQVDLLKDTENQDYFERKISFSNKLTEEQKERLFKIANACPIHKILEKGNKIETQIIN